MTSLKFHGARLLLAGGQESGSAFSATVYKIYTNVALSQCMYI